MKSGERKVVPFRTATMSTQIVVQVRDALFAKALRPGDFLGTEKDLAERFGVSRIVARDALRTLEAQGVVEIKVGSGGGARIAKGNARLFAEALAVQLDLAGVSVGEIMDAQRAIECRAAELAAVNSTAADHARLRELIAEAERKRSPRRPTTASWWCSSSRCNTSPGRRIIRRLRRTWRAASSTPTRNWRHSSKYATPPARAV